LDRQNRRGRERALATHIYTLIEVIAGALLVLLIVCDAVGTLVVTQGQSGLWRPTRLWYALTWRTARLTAIRLPQRAGDGILNVYPAVSLLGLLVVWLSGLVLGWTLIYRALGEHPEGAHDWETLLYYAGSSLLTPAFGTAHDLPTRVLSLTEALTGLGTIALLISYLPALYGGYSKREARLLTLDDPQGGRLTPVRVIATHAADQNLELLYRFFAEWELWTAEVLESHSSYPMLALFRSQHVGQSWITALGVVTDAATLTCAAIPGTDRREPYFQYQRGRRAIHDIAARLHVPPSSMTGPGITRDGFEFAWGVLSELGLPLREKEEAWSRLDELRSGYGARFQELIDFLLAPHGFWGHSAEETVLDEVAQASMEARLRARRTEGREAL
jgi:hypothetical protein